MKLHARILAGLVAGVAIGALARSPGAEWLEHAIVATEPIGTAFIRLVSMVVIPLVVASLFTGVASLGDVRRLGRIGGKTLLFFAVSTVCAAAIGLVVAMAFGVGTGVSAPMPGTIPHPGSTLPGVAVPSLIESLLAMIPSNPIASAAQGDLLPLIVAVCIFGAAATATAGETRRAVVIFFQGINDLSMVVIGWLMQLAPIAVLVLAAVTVARSGADLLGSLLIFCLAVVVALALHVAIVLLPLLRIGAGLGAPFFFRSVSDALLLAFSTASSNATLPVSMAAARNRLGVSNQVVSFVLPLGSSLDKNGAAAYKAVTAVFIARLYGMHIGASLLVAIVVMSTVAAFAGTGVPGSSLVTTLIVLDGIGLGSYAAAGIALVVGVDRPLDMCRTLVNTLGNLVGTAAIARSEGEAIG
ncbi:MAG TPA: dicarboxylate/amino acid:cation symporter [Gemmatimonadales bacterium]|jgi:DAACS family dicarboxylate/amino acid:cation (Na+ or H+) symporter